jgi:hypothetical protein
MRRALTLLSVAAWLGVHALLWAELPQLPRHVLPADGWTTIAGFTPDNASLIANNRGRVCEWDVTTGELKRAWPCYDGFSRVKCLSPDGRTFVFDDRGHDTLAILDVESGEWTILSAIHREVYGEGPRILNWLGVPPSFSPDGRFLAYAAGLPKTQSFAVRLWDILNHSGSEVVFSERCFSPAFAPDGATIAVWIDGAKDVSPHVSLIDVESRREDGRLVTPPGELVRLAFAPDGKTLAVWGIGPPWPSKLKDTSWIQLWDVPSRQLNARVPDAWLVDWAADGRLLAAGTDGLHKYDGHTGAKLATLTSLDLRDRWFFWGTFAGHRIAIVTSVQVPPTWHSWLIRKLSLPEQFQWQTRHAVRLFDAQTGDEITVVWANGYPPAMSPDGRTLATFPHPTDMEGDNFIFLWDIPPRTPGGVVLGLMIVEVALFIAWTAWRRRLFRRVSPRRNLQ